MKYLDRTGLACGLMMAALGCAHAQAPLTEKNVSMKMAQMIIDGAIEQCTKDGFRVSVVVVDNAGGIKAMLRGDGSGAHTVEVSRRKAYTARTRGQTTIEFRALVEAPGNAALMQIPDLITLGGGVPIKAAGVTIGGVGVGGAPAGEKDEACAMAGLAKVADFLK